MDDERIIFFTERASGCSIIRFVKGFRKRKWWRKERVEYTVNSIEAYQFGKEEEVPVFIEERIRKDYPESHYNLVSIDSFFTTFQNCLFYTIERWKEVNVDYFTHFDNGAAGFSTDMDEVFMTLAKDSAEETKKTILIKQKEILVLRPVYLNIFNYLMLESFMITCTHKQSGETFYFKDIDSSNRVRTCRTSRTAMRFSYECALKWFDRLRLHHKMFLYAVLPVFKDNVHCKNIAEYMESKNVSREIVMSFRINDINKT